MKTSMIIAFFVIFAARSLPASEISYEHFSYAFGKCYKSSIPSLARTPRWNVDEDNPPLSARKAILLADAEKAKLVKDTKDYRWRRTEASVIFAGNKGYCYWRITYEANVREGGSSGPPITLELFVLMDGTLIEPEVSDEK